MEASDRAKRPSRGEQRIQGVGGVPDGQPTSDNRPVEEAEQRVPSGQGEGSQSERGCPAALHGHPASL